MLRGDLSSAGCPVNQVLNRTALTGATAIDCHTAIIPSNCSNWPLSTRRKCPPPLQSNQLGNGHKLAQLSFQRCSTNIGTEQLHWDHLCQRQISKVGRKYKGGEIEAFADAINEKAKILTCGAKPPLKSALSAYHALQNVVQSCPQQTFAFAGQKWNRLRQTMAK